MWISTEGNGALISTENISSIIVCPHPDFDFNGIWRVRAFGNAGQAYDLRSGSEADCKSFLQGLLFNLEERETRQVVALERIATALESSEQTD